MDRKNRPNLPRIRGISLEIRSFLEYYSPREGKDGSLNDAGPYRRPAGDTLARSLDERNDHIVVG
jgi:hypothetical protein